MATQDSMGWNIRQADATDAELILPLLWQVQAIHVAVEPDIYRADPNREELLGFLREFLSNEGITGLLALGEDGSAIGYAIYEAVSREASALRHPQRYGLLHYISVDRARRRAGVGSALIEEMRSRLRSLGIRRMRITYAAFNGPSAALMRKAGLEPAVITAEGPV